MQIRIYYEDTDIGGIVYHTNYIKYCERARSEIFFEAGMMPGEGSERGFMVTELQAKFLKSATLGDMLEVKTYTEKIKNVSVALRQEIYRGEEKIFTLTLLLVYGDKGRISKIPPEVCTLFEKLPIA